MFQTRVVPVFIIFVRLQPEINSERRRRRGRPATPTMISSKDLFVAFQVFPVPTSPIHKEDLGHGGARGGLCDCPEHHG